MGKGSSLGLAVPTVAGAPRAAALCPPAVCSVGSVANRGGWGIRSIEDLKNRCFVDDDEHWVWRGAADPDGRPRLWLTALGQTVSMSRAIGTLVEGQRPDKRTIWRATCGFAECGNPSHRKPGTRSARMKQAKFKQTPLAIAKISTARRAQSVVSDDELHAMRLSGATASEMSERSGLSRSYCSRILAGGARASVHAPGASVFSWGGA